MTHRMLFGRSAMKDFVIAPDHSYLLGRPTQVKALYKNIRVKAKKKSTSKTRSAPAVDRAALCSSVDVLAAIKWLEQMSTMALADTLMALDAGNLAAFTR